MPRFPHVNYGEGNIFNVICLTFKMYTRQNEDINKRFRLSLATKFDSLYKYLHGFVFKFQIPADVVKYDVCSRLTSSILDK